MTEWDPLILILLWPTVIMTYWSRWGNRILEWPLQRPQLREHRGMWEEDMVNHKQYALDIHDNFNGENAFWGKVAMPQVTPSTNWMLALPPAFFLKGWPYSFTTAFLLYYIEEYRCIWITLKILLLFAYYNISLILAVKHVLPFGGVFLVKMMLAKEIM